MNQQIENGQKSTEFGAAAGRWTAVVLVEMHGLTLIAAALFFVTATMASGGTIHEKQEQGCAGVIVSSQASAKEVGLPVYPGAKPHQDEKEESSATQLGIWGGSFGFKLAVMKMESGDASEKIAAFYKKALGKYGPVLNCSDPSQKVNTPEKRGGGNQIECGDDKPEKGGILFKAGTKEKQHIVAIQSRGQGSLFQLVYLEARGRDKGKPAS